MTGQVVYSLLGPKEVRQLQEVYDRAKAVRAEYPATHAASIAATKLINAFETGTNRTFLDTWLLDTCPQGSA
jgi:hypothetical protein